MSSKLASPEKYRVIQPQPNGNLESVVHRFVGYYVLLCIIWLIFSFLSRFPTEWQVISIVVLLVYHFGNKESTFVRSQVDLKAKGIDITDPKLTAIMPWEWLTKVEIRQRTVSIFPNYVYFAFKDKSDVLILWDDVKETIDSRTLVSCVKTWAPRAEILGDAKLAQAESIATYTELWLKDFSLTRPERRLRQNQILDDGTILSNSYRIERVLSGGGQGTAYLASVLPGADVPGMPSQVVIKELILPANERGLKKATDGLLKEVAILRRISHPLIVRLYDCFVEDMRGYLAIEFVEGATLRSVVAESGPMQEKKAARIGAQLCDALDYLHGLSPAIIHGDLTPDNVMFEKRGSIKLLDFDASQELTRNKTNTVVGKHSYMSPEQFKGELGEASDIYGLGCTLHYLVTGTDPEPISQSHPRASNPNVNEKFDSIVSRATSFEKTDRYSRLEEMRADLGRV